MMVARLYYGSKVLILEEIKKHYSAFDVVNDINLATFKTSYSKIFDSNNIYIHNNFSTSDLKIISEFIDAGLGNHIFYYEDDSFDGRNGLIQKLKKSNDIYDFSLPVFGDKSKLTSLLRKYNLSYDVVNWLCENCPTTRTKSKTTGRKDVVCYDIDLLGQEITKLQSVKSELTIEDFNSSEFKKDADIFQFISDVLDKKTDKALNDYLKLVDHMGEQGLLLVFLSQLYFLIKIADIKDKKIFNESQYMNRIDLKDILGQYLNDDWEIIKPINQSTNPIRAKIELNKLSLNVNQLSKILDLVAESIIDLRNGGSKHHSIELLIHKIAIV
jgi:hypothetical protein